MAIGGRPIMNGGNTQITRSRILIDGSNGKIDWKAELERANLECEGSNNLQLNMYCILLIIPYVFQNCRCVKLKSEIRLYGFKVQVIATLQISIVNILF